MISERRLQNDCGMIEGDRQMHAHRGPPLGFILIPRAAVPASIRASKAASSIVNPRGLIAARRASRQDE